MTARAVVQALATTLAHRLAVALPGPRRVSRRIRPAQAEPVDHLEVRLSWIAHAGLGLFTKREFLPGELLLEYTGDKLTTWEHYRRRDWSYTAKCNGWYLDASPYREEILGARVNHHFNPKRRNARFEERHGRLYIMATQRILPGQEIYVDYGLTYWRLDKVGGLIV